jgi:hypothetical protein
LGTTLHAPRPMKSGTPNIDGNRHFPSAQLDLGGAIPLGGLGRG